MSILLDALKKSEEQRRLGQSPDIHQPTATDMASATGDRSWPAFAMLAAAVVVMAWLGWRPFASPHAGSPPPGQRASSGESREAVTATPPAARTPVESLPVQPGTEAAPGGTVADATDEKQGVVRSFTAYKADEKTEPAAKEEAAVAEASAVPAPGAPTPTPAQEPGPRDSHRRLEPPVTEPISYWAVPQGVRDSMPEFHISVLVYAKEPGDRFILMNGQRLREKDKLDEGVTLDEIRRDGAVFSYRKYRFLVRN